MSTTADFEKLTVTQLKEKLKAKTLSTTGTKAVLIERLVDAVESEEKLLGEDVCESTGSKASTPKSLEDELLNESGDKEIEKTEEAKEPVKEAIKEVVVETAAVKVERPGRKLITFPEPEVAKETKVESSVTEGGKTVIKSPEDEDKERLLKRAAKFNITPAAVLPETERKKLRSERFGLIEGPSSTPEASTAADTGDKKAERAKRFNLSEAETKTTTNGSASKKRTITEPIAVDDATLAKRAERFGIQNYDLASDVKKKARMERFGAK
uniref:SAP domain-containing protein n=1 Tax=Rhabditophanes sp. KR3021 TaxID=114890 RepID=A0AC35UD43_9BILA